MNWPNWLPSPKMLGLAFILGAAVGVIDSMRKRPRDSNLSDDATSETAEESPEV